MRTIPLLAQVIVTLTLLFHGTVSAVTKEKSAIHTVTIEGMKFIPDVLNVKVGDTVIWINKDIVPHTATGQKKEFDSREIKPTRSWKHRVTKKGNLSYSCSFHPTMKASLIVN